VFLGNINGDGFTDVGRTRSYSAQSITVVEAMTGPFEPSELNDTGRLFAVPELLFTVPPSRGIVTTAGSLGYVGGPTTRERRPQDLYIDIGNELLVFFGHAMAEEPPTNVLPNAKPHQYDLATPLPQTLPRMHQGIDIGIDDTFHVCDSVGITGTASARLPNNTLSRDEAGMILPSSNAGEFYIGSGRFMERASVAHTRVYGPLELNGLESQVDISVGTTSGTTVVFVFGSKIGNWFLNGRVNVGTSLQRRHRLQGTFELGSQAVEGSAA
jgi:hypothetical protein